MLQQTFGKATKSLLSIIGLKLNPTATLARIRAELLMSHAPTAQCSMGECLICGYADCPSNDPLHYHHDGCPSCSMTIEGVN